MVAVAVQPSPILLRKERLFVGIDIGKEAHVAAFLSGFLIRKHRHYTACPTISFENSRLDFERLLQAMQAYAPLEQCVVVMERTGHYHLALLQYLQEQGVEVYLLHVTKRPSKQKNDKLDAQNLANTLYSQVELGAQPSSTEQEVHKVLPVSSQIQVLRSLTQYRADLARQITRIKNKLTAISDTLFPEFSLIFKDVNGPTARIFREKFPTPRDVAAASLDELKECRIWSRPGNKALEQLQELAKESIGIKEPGRIRALILEQRLLIRELRVLEQNEEEVKQEITAVVEQSREGQILLSLGDFVGPNTAAEIVACIGSIENFERAGKLRGYAGWCPIQDQTGTSRDSMVLSKGGNRMLRNAMYFMGMRAVKQDTEWRKLHHRLVEKQCPLDERLKRRKGKMKPMSRVIGQMLNMIYVFLKKDAEVIAKTPPGDEPPPPTLYNREIHKSHLGRHR